MAEPTLVKARLIPVSGIGSAQEAEQRATSAFLAVLSVVRELSTELLTPLGASRAQKATVETFIEVKMPKTKIRPDGMIRVDYGRSSWSAFVEVKTGSTPLSAEQINGYWDLAREWGIDHVLTISNDIAPKAGVHPTDGLRVRSNSPVQISHLSWSAIVSAAIRIKQHKGVSDAEQAWLLDELIRYLEHEKSGALDFSDMGQHWVPVREAAREGSLTKRTEGISTVVERWDQLLRFGALRLSAQVGEDVTIVVPRGQGEAKQRSAALTESLTNSGLLGGGLKVPNTAGDLRVSADLRARQIAASVQVNAPKDKGPIGRVSWLVNQLDGASGDLVIEAYGKSSRVGILASLAEIRDDRSACLDSEKREPFRFVVTKRVEMGMGRKAGTRSPGFIDTVLGLIEDFYRDVVQQITPWQAPAPKLRQPKPAVQGPDEASFARHENRSEGGEGSLS